VCSFPSQNYIRLLKKSATFDQKLDHDTPQSRSKKVSCVWVRLPTPYMNENTKCIRFVEWHSAFSFGMASELEKGETLLLSHCIVDDEISFAAVVCGAIEHISFREMHLQVMHSSPV
jgi:hypothetical protein